MTENVPTDIDKLIEGDRPLSDAVAYHSFKPVSSRLGSNALFPSAKFALWPDAFCLWTTRFTHENSENFLSGTVDMDRFGRIMDLLHSDGFFDEATLEREVNGIDVPYETIYLSHRGKTLTMRSSSGFRRRAVHTSSATLAACFAQASADALGYLYAWERVENSLMLLRPSSGQNCVGSFVYHGLDLVWRPDEFVRLND